MSKTVPDYILNMARGETETAKTEVANAKQRIDEKYHDFLVLLDQHVRLHQEAFNTNIPYEKKQGLRIWSSEKRGTYVTVAKPYVTVDGRIKMARDEHKEKEAKLHISQPVIEVVGGKTLLSVSVSSELYGDAVGMIEVGEGKGVDAVNPFANAQTSAIGRALGFLGYGLVGTGVIASPEEMRSALTDGSDEKPTQDQQTNNASTSFRLRVEGIPQFNRDRSSSVEVMLESRQKVSLILPKQLEEFAKSLKVGDVMHVNGWLNKERLRMDTKIPPSFEDPQSETA